MRDAPLTEPTGGIVYLDEDVSEEDFRRLLTLLHVSARPHDYAVFVAESENMRDEALCFGLMIENASWGVYRIWSRAWLVTK